MSAVAIKDPKDFVYAVILQMFADIPIPRTRGGNGWFFLNASIPGFIGKIIKRALSVDSIMLIETGVPLEQVIFAALMQTQRSASDQARVEALQLELSGGGDKKLYDIIENTIKTLPENGWRSGRYLKDEAARKKFISRIIDEFFGQKGNVILPAVECLLLVQAARQKFLSLQDQAVYLANAFEKKLATIKP